MHLNTFIGHLHEMLTSFHKAFPERSFHKTSVTKQRLVNGLKELPPNALHVLHNTNPIIQTGMIGDVELVTFKWQRYDVKMYLLHTPHLPPVRRIVYYVCLFLHLIQHTIHQAQSNNTTRHEIQLILTAFSNLKIFPQGQEEITRIHVNGGVNWNGYAMVYRKQEFFKVLMHELLHYVGLDDAFRSYSHLVGPVEEQFAKRYGIHTPRMGLNETYNDLITCLWVIGIPVYNSRRNASQSKQNFIKAYHAQLVTTKTYMIHRCAAILKHFNIGPPVTFPFRHNAFQEQSHVFTYFICKTALFYTLPLTLNKLGVPWEMSEDKLALFMKLVQKAIELKGFVSKLNGALYSPHRRVGLRMLDIEIK